MSLIAGNAPNHSLSYVSIVGCKRRNAHGHKGGTIMREVNNMMHFVGQRRGPFSIRSCTALLSASRRQ